MANWVSFANALQVKEKNTRFWNMNSEKWNESHWHGVERSRKTGSELLLALAVWVSGSCPSKVGRNSASKWEVLEKSQKNSWSNPFSPALLIGCSHLGDSEEKNFPASLSKKLAVSAKTCIPVTLTDSAGFLGHPSHGTIITAQSFRFFCILPTSSASSWKNRRPLTRRTLEIQVGIMKTMRQKYDQLPRGLELTTWCSRVIQNDFHQSFQLLPLKGAT